MASSVQQLAKALSCHAWDPSQQQLAVCPNSTEVHIYQAADADAAWQRQHVLAGHDNLVTAIDWSPVHGHLVSCSHDRSAIVWQYDSTKQVWGRQRVVTRMRLAALCVRWSPDGTKFAVGSSDKSLSVCHFEAQHSWWACRSLAKGKHGSSILAVSWHPTSQLLASVSTDCTCRIVNASLPDVDDQSTAPAICSAMRTGGVLLEVPSNSGWCTAVAWSPSGMQLAFTAHSCTVTVVSGLDVTASSAGSFQAAADIHRLSIEPHSPMRAIGFLTEDRIVAGGFDGRPLQLTCRAGAWSLRRSAEQGLQNAGEVRITPTKPLAKEFSSKMALFSSSKAAKSADGTHTSTVTSPHLSAIAELRVLHAAGSVPPRFSTAGWDGRVVLWDPDPHSRGLIGALR